MNRLEQMLAEMSKLRGIKLDFVVPTLMITFIVTVGLGVVMGVTSIIGINDSMDSKGHALSSFLAKVAPNYVTNYDLAALQGFVDELAKNSDVVYASFSDKDGRILSETK